MVVTDSSPLIYLAALSDFDLLRGLFGRVVIPRRVYYEVITNGRGLVVPESKAAIAEGWIVVRDIADPAAAESLMNRSGLHRGESEAIQLALETGARVLLMDDQAAVDHARGYGINVLRTPGIYRMAKERRQIGEIRPRLDALRRKGFRLKDEHYEAILRLAGET